MSKRLMTEYRELSINPPEGITAGPVSESNWFLWEAMIQGPSVSFSLVLRNQCRNAFLKVLIWRLFPLDFQVFELGF